MLFGKSALAVLVALATVFVLPAASLAGDKDAKKAIDLSPELMALLRAEMADLSGGLQRIALFIATADWTAVEKTSQRMHESYIMKKSLTQSQAMELKRNLPDEFKQLDAAFHARAEQIGRAAASRDAELAVFHYSRLIEACTGCHSKFAMDRFPGFANARQEQHER